MDAIDRQAAIDAVKQREWLTQTAKEILEEVMEQLPPVQPEKRTQERTETHACDLISRQAAIDEFEKELSAKYNRRELAIGFVGIKSILEQLPSVQPEIIRCKDCKYRDAEDGFCEGRGWPMQLVPDDGFCDKGERSEE